MAQLHDLSNEILLLILMETDIESLLSLATLSRNLNHLAIMVLHSLTEVSFSKDELEITPQTIEKGIIRALNIEIPFRTFSRICCSWNNYNATRILRETTHFLQRSTDVSYFRLSGFDWLGVETAPDREWAALLASVSKHLHLNCLYLSHRSSNPMQQTLQVSESLTPLDPMHQLQRIDIDTRLIIKPYFQQWFIQSMNSSPLQELTLVHRSSELLQNLHLNQLDKFTITLVHHHAFEDLHEFLERHCHITSLHISGVSKTMPSELPLLLFNNLIELSTPAIYFPSFIPTSDHDLPLYSSKKIELLPRPDIRPNASTYFEDAINGLSTPGGGTFTKVHFSLNDEVPEWMKRQVSNAMNSQSCTLTPLMDVTSLNVTARFDIRDLLVCWIGLKFTELEELSVSLDDPPRGDPGAVVDEEIGVVPLPNVRSLDLRLSGQCDMQSLQKIFPKFIGSRFPQLEECSITFWDSGFVEESRRPSEFLGVKVIRFVRMLVKECPMLDYVQINHDRKHTSDWMVEDIEDWDAEKEENTLKLMAKYYRFRVGGFKCSL